MHGAFSQAARGESPRAGPEILESGDPTPRKEVFGEGFAHDVADVHDPEASLLYRWIVKDQWKLLQGPAEILVRDLEVEAEQVGKGESEGKHEPIHHILRAPRQLTQKEFELLMEFMYALTDPNSIDIRRDTPMVVPSGLPLAD